MIRIKGMAAAFGLATLALSGAAGAQAPITSASPTSVGTDSTARGAPPVVTSTNPPSAAPATSSAPAPEPAGKAPEKVIPQFYKPTPGIGQPSADSISLQPQETAIGLEAARMHNYILVPVMAAVSLLVLLLLIWVILRFRAGANPVPSKTHHNTAIEIIWTLTPVLVLALIAIPSIKLLAHQYSPPKADLTVKVVGNQWYWEYQYPDHGNLDIVSNMLPEKADANGKRSRTDTDGAVTPYLVTGAGGYHNLHHVMKVNHQAMTTPVVLDRADGRVVTLHSYLDDHHGFMVMISGSKFYTGTPFSGALLVPPAHPPRHPTAAAPTLLRPTARTCTPARLCRP